MASVDWSVRALNHIDRIVAYLNVFDPVAAHRTRASLLAAGNSLVEFPRRGRPGLDGTRELATCPPYVISYDVVDDRVTILAIRHGRQIPPTASTLR